MASQTIKDSLAFKLSAGAQTTLENWLATQACGKIDAAYSLSGATASTVTKNITSVAFFWDDSTSPGEVQVRVQYKVPGEWNPS